MGNSVYLKNKEQILTETLTLSKSIVALCSEINVSLNAISRQAQAEVTLSPASLSACTYAISQCRKSVNVLSSYGKNLYGAFSSGLGVISKADSDIADSFVENVKELGWKVAKKAGVIGSILAAGEKAFNVTKDGSISGWRDAIKGVYDSGKSLYKAGKDLKTFSPILKGMSTSDKINIVGKKLIGGQDYFYVNHLGAASKASSLSTRWYNNFQKINANEVSKFSKATFWAGTAISGVANLMQNKEEHGGYTGRAIAETITETAIDVGTTYVLTTAVAATLACTPIGAPVLVVAAGVTALKWGADKICQSLTGESFTEWASDTIIDGAKAAFEADVERVKWAAGKISDGATAVYEKAKDGYKKMADATTNCFNKVADGLSAGWKKVFG